MLSKLQVLSLYEVTKLCQSILHCPLLDATPIQTVHSQETMSLPIVGRKAVSYKDPADIALRIIGEKISPFSLGQPLANAILILYSVDLGFLSAIKGIYLKVSIHSSLTNLMHSIFMEILDLCSTPNYAIFLQRAL